MNSLLIVMVLLFGLMFLLGLIFLIVALVSKKKTENASQWPTAPGQVFQSSVEEHTDQDDEGMSSTSYEPRVEYSFSVMGQTYQGKRIAYGPNRIGLQQAQQKVAAYPAGANVTVHYNPQNPNDAVLEVKAGGGNKVFMIVGIVLMVLSVLGCCGGSAIAMLVQS